MYFKHNHAGEFTENAENPYFSREAVLYVVVSKTS